jgi:hypothetical protein
VNATTAMVMAMSNWILNVVHRVTCDYPWLGALSLDFGPLSLMSQFSYPGLRVYYPGLE